MAVLTITKDNFEKEVMRAEEPVLLDFWASWCGPCKMAAPVVDAVAKEQEGRAKIGKVNIDEQPELSQMFEVMNIPTFAVLRDGKVREMRVGLQSKTALTEMLEQ